MEWSPFPVPVGEVLYMRYMLRLLNEVMFVEIISTVSATQVTRHKCELMRLVEKAVAPHSSTLAWKIPWTEEPGGLQSMGSRRIGHD